MQDISESLYQTFGVLIEVGLMDVNILIKNGMTNLWSLHYYQPYSKDCHSFEIFQIGTFSSENYTHELGVAFIDLFPRKHFTFHECKLHIAIFSFEPFVIIRDGSNGSTVYDGIEFIVVNEISKTLKLSPTFVQRNRGMMYKNGTSSGAIKMVRTCDDSRWGSKLP